MTTRESHDMAALATKSMNRPRVAATVAPRTAADAAAEPERVRDRERERERPTLPTAWHRVLFEPVAQCWVCGSHDLRRFHELVFDFSPYAEQDPGLHEYTGQTAWLMRCRGCGFGQPEVLPTLGHYFDRMYDQRWSPDWVEQEFSASYKDLIFARILDGLQRRRRRCGGRLLDVGAHAGRFLHVAQQHGWTVEGIELNPRTAACAARRTGAPVHCLNVQALGDRGVRYDAVTLTDVLEHIPQPVTVLTEIGRLVEPGGWVAIKVPNGRSQWHKERVLAAVRPSRRVSLADNLVHVNHFSPRALARALATAGFREISVRTAPPELPPATSVGGRTANVVRRAIYQAGLLPGATVTPLALHLQAFARKPS